MTTTKPPVAYWIIASIAVLWNLMGVGAFASDLMVTPELISKMEPAMQEMYNNNPMWLKVVYGIATITGLLGSIGLLLRKNWAIPLFLISLITVFIQMTYSMLGTNAIEAVGTTGAVVFPIIVIIIAAFLWYYAKKALNNDWIA
jgi:hypothetical protein